MYEYSIERDRYYSLQAYLSHYPVRHPHHIPPPSSLSHVHFPFLFIIVFGGRGDKVAAWPLIEEPVDSTEKVVQPDVKIK